MINIKKFFKLFMPFIICLAFICITCSVAADSPMPEEAYSIKVNTEYIFIMADESYFEGDLFFSSTGELYKKAGLYLNNGSAEPIWEIDFYIYEQDLYILDDGIHFARKPYWSGKGSLNQMAVQFFKDGELFRSYMISELVTNQSKLVESVSHIWWLNDVYQNDDELHLKTKDNHYYVFDIKSGDITNHERITEDLSEDKNNNPDKESISKDNDSLIIYFGIAAILIGIVVASIFYFLGRSKNEKDLS